jgi:hypothetical protein
MSNVSRVNGFRPVSHLNGSPYNGQVNIYAIPASDGTAVFVGDMVKLSGDSDALGVPTVIQAAAGDAVLGAVVGFVPLYTNLALAGSYRLASTLRYAYVADAPDLIFEAQEDAVGGAMATTDVGLNVELIVGSGSTSTGQSGMQVDTSTKATTATLALKIRGFVQRPDNEVGSANAKMLVSVNKHQLNSGTGSAGV